MICVSQPDEGAFKHLDFNQNPSPLAPGQTTCEDLNGIANLREHVGACQDTGGGASGAIFAALDEKNALDPEPPGSKEVAPAGYWSSGTWPRAVPCFRWPV